MSRFARVWAVYDEMMTLAFLIFLSWQLLPPELAYLRYMRDECTLLSIITFDVIYCRRRRATSDE
jgi:hypothetical protein